MEVERLERDFITLESALAKIKVNESKSYQWYPVKNKKGCLLEAGGTHMDLKFYIPKYKNSKPVSTRYNNFVDSAYSLEVSKIEFGDFSDSYNKINTEEKLIKFVNNTDFTKWQPKIEETEIFESRFYKTIVN